MKDWEWGKLLPELRIQILQLLPLQSAAKCRAVCREWKYLLTKWRPSGAWFLVRQEQTDNLGWSLIESSTGDWIQLCQGVSRFATSAVVGDGLVCLCVGNAARPDFYVGNPVFSSSWTRLPDLPPLKSSALARLVLSTSLPTCVLGIVCGAEPDSFKVLVARCGFVFLYECWSGKWKEVEGDVPSLAVQVMQEMEERPLVPVRRKNQLLWYPLRASGGVVGFDLETCSWSVFESRLIERLTVATLSVDLVSGSVILLGAHRSSGSHHFRFVKTWELDEDRGQWRAVNRMKEFMVQEISPKGFFTACWNSSSSQMALLSCTLEKFSSQTRDWGFKRLVIWDCMGNSGKWSTNPIRRPLKNVEIGSCVVYPFLPRLDFCLTCPCHSSNS